MSSSKKDPRVMDENDPAFGLRKNLIKLFNLTKWPKVIQSGVETIWDFSLFLFMVIAVSTTEDDGQCSDDALQAVCITLGLRFAGFAFHGTKFALVLLNQLPANGMSFIDTIFFFFDSLWTIWIAVVFIKENGDDCMDDQAIIWYSLLLGTLNGVIKIIQFIAYFGTCSLVLTFMFRKMLPFKALGHSVGFLENIFGDHQEKEEPKKKEE